MSKWNWIAQDKDGDIFFYDEEPLLMPFGFMSGGKDLKLVGKCKKNQIHEETLINLKTEDYEINDGILTRITRKTELDKLITKVKKIDKKAAKWMNNNRYKLEDINYLSFCFDWEDCTKYDWESIFDKLAEMEEPQKIKEILRYRVARFGYNTITVNNNDKENEIQLLRGFDEWLTDWIEVEA